MKFLLYILLILPLWGLAGEISPEPLDVDELHEKEILVAMRTVGHQVLWALGDSTSRVLPVSKIEDYYKIPFEASFGFDPEMIAAVIDSVLHDFSDDYLVEVEQCETGSIVHTYIVRRPSVITCVGRDLPVDCYSLLITILPPFEIDPVDSTAVAGIGIGDGAENLNHPPGDATGGGTTRLGLLLIPVVGLITFLGYRRFSKNGDPDLPLDPHIISLGSYRFDKRNMKLTRQGVDLELSHKETELLALLHEQANEPLERAYILEKVWGDEGDYVGRTLDVFISKLRKKLEADEAVRIVNIRGVGYKLVLN